MYVFMAVTDSYYPDIKEICSEINLILLAVLFTKALIGSEPEPL